MSQRVGRVHLDSVRVPRAACCAGQRGSAERGLCVAALCVAAPKSRHLAARVEVISVVRALGVEAVRICASEAFHKLHVEGGLPRQLHSRQWKRRHRGAIL